MTSLIKTLILGIVYHTGICRILQWFQKGKLSILIYHDPKPEHFEKHIKYLLKKKYSIVPLDEALNSLKSDNKILPKENVVITFDDGHKGNFRLLSLFIKYQIKPTIFLTAEYIGSNKPFWFNHKDEIKPMVNLKKISNTERLELMNRSSFNFFEQNIREALSIEEIKEMKDYVDFQSHTLTHPILPYCDDKTSLIEVVNSKLLLQQILNKPIEGFAYPNGDYTEREIEFCKKAGYKYALTIRPGFNTLRTSFYELKRIGTNDTDSMSEFAVRVSGFWSLLKRFA